MNPDDKLFMEVLMRNNTNLDLHVQYMVNVLTTLRNMSAEINLLSRKVIELADSVTHIMAA